MGSTNTSSWLDWLWGLFSGWFPIPEDYEHKVGDTIKIVHSIENTGIVAADDNEVISQMLTKSDAEIKEEVERAAGGGEINIISRNARVIEPGWKWEHEIVYECTKASPFPVAAVVIIVGIAIVLYLLIEFTEKVEGVFKQLSGSQKTMFLFIIAAIVGLFLLIVIKDLLD